MIGLPRNSVRLSLAGAALVATLAGCHRSEDARPVSIVASGDTAGWIVPCGCASNQYGGLPRRASYVRELSEERTVLVVDVGGAAAGTSSYDRVKFEAILRGEAAMGVAAHNIGASEAALGAAYLREVADRISVPLLSCNVRTTEGALVGNSSRIVRVGGRRIALLGVLDPKRVGGSLTADPPRDAILAALRDLEGQYDSAIVLAYLPADGLRELAAALPEVDAVVGGPTGQPIAPETIGPVLLTSATNKGKFLARLDAPERGSKRWTASIVSLSEQLADDSEQLTNLRSYFDLLAQRDFSPGQTGLVAALPSGLPSDYRIAGTASCRPCHAEDCAKWDLSKHAHAWPSLAAKGAQSDPECQRCHTTGYGLPGGFASPRRTPELAQVGCEDCHGPSQGHVRSPANPTPMHGRAKDQCLGCHDRENSPAFQYTTYWAKMAHGAKASLRPTAPKTTHEDRR